MKILLRQLKDIICQADYIKNNPSKINIESFSKFSEELKASLKVHYGDVRIHELITIIPEISLQPTHFRFWHWFFRLKVINAYEQADMESFLQKVELTKKLYQSILTLIEDEH